MTSRRQQPQQLFTGTTGHGAATGDDSRSMSSSILPIHQRQKRKTSHVATDFSGSIIASGNTTTGSNSVWSPANNNNSGHPAPQPRSGTGSFVPDLLELINVRDKTDATAKRRFQVRVPGRLLVVLAMVFLIVPLVIFWHKEVHIHEDHDEAHFKARKYVNVNTQDVMAEFGKHVHNRQDQNDNGDSDSSEDEVHQQQPADLGGGTAVEEGIGGKDGASTKSNDGSSDGVVLVVEEEDSTATETQKNLTTAGYLAQKDENKEVGSTNESGSTTEDENAKRKKSISSTTATNTTEEEVLSVEDDFKHQSTTNATTRRQQRQRRRASQQKAAASRMR